MAAKLKGSIKVKADKDYKKGDEIELTDQEFTADQDDFEAALEGRLKREKKKTDEAEEKAKTVEAELEELKKKGGKESGEVDAKTAERLANLENENKRLLQNMKIDAAIKKAGVELPAQFRNAISLKPNAGEDAIEDAVKEQVKAYNELKKSLGVKEKAEGEEEEETPPAKPGAGMGAGGQGKVTEKKNPELEGLMELAKRHQPGMVQNLSSLDDAGKAEVLKEWQNQGLLEAKKK